jgi:hypothetical protein
MKSKTQPKAVVGAHASRAAARMREDALDEALDDTFPASDPIAVGRPTSTEPPRAPVDRKAPVFATS